MFFGACGCVWTSSDPFGLVRTHSDAFRCFQKSSEVFAKSQIFSEFHVVGVFENLNDFKNESENEGQKVATKLKQK